MRFELKAITQDGRIESVDCQALDEQPARAQAEGRGYTVLAVRARRDLATLWRSGERFPLPLFSQELLVLLNAGLPLVEAIETLAQKERRDEFRGGARAASSPCCARASRSPPRSSRRPPPSRRSTSPRCAPPSAPATSRRRSSRYVAYQAQLEAIRKRVVNASIYPLLLMGVGGLVSLFLLLYVVPRFGKIYEERGSDLPLFSQLLLPGAAVAEAHAGVVLGDAGGAGRRGRISYCASARCAPRSAMRCGACPAIGERLKVYQLARFYRTTGMLLKGGMPLVAALEMAAELLHPVLRERLVAASRAISEGPRRVRLDGRQRPHHAGGAAHAGGGRVERQHGRHDGAASPASTTRSCRAGSTGSRACSSRS